jgi:hypothetical protein
MRNRVFFRFGLGICIRRLGRFLIECPSVVLNWALLLYIEIAWVVINMVPFGMALGYAYLPHTRTVRQS